MNSSITTFERDHAQAREITSAPQSPAASAAEIHGCIGGFFGFAFTEQERA